MRRASVPVSTPKAHPSTLPLYGSSKSLGLGATQISVGASCIFVQIIEMCIQTGFGQGIWCGAFFVVAGLFGIAAGKTKRTVFVKTFMVLSILAAFLFSAILICFAIVSLIQCGHSTSINSEKMARERYFAPANLDHYSFGDLKVRLNNFEKVTGDTTTGGTSDSSSHSTSTGSQVLLENTPGATFPVPVGGKENEINKCACKTTNATEGILFGLATFEAVVAVISCAICCQSSLYCLNPALQAQEVYPESTRGKFVLTTQPSSGQPQHLNPGEAAAPQPP